MSQNLRDILLGVDQIGCGYEATLESFYRFLIDPETYLTIEVEDVDLILPKEALTVRSAAVENVALQRGVPIKPTEFENFENHMAAHSQRRQELEAEGASEQVLGYFDAHIAETAAMAEQAGGQQAATDQPQTDQLGGDRPGGQEATGLAAAAGSQGVPGAAAPGPGGAPGRPG